MKNWLDFVPRRVEFVSTTYLWLVLLKGCGSAVSSRLGYYLVDLTCSKVVVLNDKVERNRDV